MLKSAIHTVKPLTINPNKKSTHFLYFFTKRNSSKKPHPTDSAKLQFPKMGHKTDWISHNHSEYFQVRKRIVAESEEFFKKAYLLATERKFEQHMEKPLVRRGPHGGGFNAEARALREDLLGEDELGDEKFLAVGKTLEINKLGLRDPEVPQKTLNQIKTLLPYIRAKSEDDFLYKCKRAILAANFRDKKTRDAYNAALASDQKKLLEAFDNDALKLIEEAEQMKTQMGQNTEVLLQGQFQDALRKWNGLLLDFSAENVGKGIVSQNEAKLEQKQPEGNGDLSRSVEEITGEQIGDLLPEDLAVNSNDSKYDELKLKVRKEAIEMTRAAFSEREAQSLLSDENVMNLIDSMRAALIESHRLLFQTLESDEEKNSENQIKQITQNDFYKKRWDIHLERIKKNRFFDLAVRSRDVFRDEDATQPERLARKFYDSLKADVFKQREDHQRLAVSSKNDFSPLRGLSGLRIRSVSAHTPLIRRDSLEGRIAQSRVTIKTPMKSFAPKVRQTIAMLFPDRIDRASHLVISSQRSPDREVNKRFALETLAKLVSEAEKLSSMDNPQNWAEYSASSASKAPSNAATPPLSQNVAARIAAGRETAAAENRRRQASFIEGALSEIERLDPAASRSQILREFGGLQKKV